MQTSILYLQLISIILVRFDIFVFISVKEATLNLLLLKNVNFHTGNAYAQILVTSAFYQATKQCICFSSWH